MSDHVISFLKTLQWLISLKKPSRCMACKPLHKLSPSDRIYFHSSPCSPPLLQSHLGTVLPQNLCIGCSPCPEYSSLRYPHGHFFSKLHSSTVTMLMILILTVPSETTVTYLSPTLSITLTLLYFFFLSSTYTFQHIAFLICLLFIVHSLH